ncbi:MAG TPA: M20 family metallopeptidase [Gaiellales bacterium]|nr:M20 family metallopeptidase [Gaiellales bacterium]
MMQPVDMLRHLVELESPTGDATRMAHIREFLAAELMGLGGRVERRGEHLVAEFGPRAPGETVAVAAHMDTVWPAGTLQRMPFAVRGDLAHGPGALDMKGGIVVMLEGIRRASPLTRPVTALLTADEEIGSPTGRPVVEEVAARSRAVLVVEPPVRDGTMTTQRSGLARYQLAIRGQAAHAGHQGGGVSAVVELAHQTLALTKLVDPDRGVRVNVGQVAGGTGDNVVAAEAWARIDARAWTAPEQQRLEAAIRGLRPALRGAELEVTGGVTRPPMIRSAESARLAGRAIEIARRLGQGLSENASGGGSDGNFAAAIGTPVLDGLGPIGAGAHADDERVSLASVEERSDLLAALIAEL